MISLVIAITAQILFIIFYKYFNKGCLFHSFKVSKTLESDGLPLGRNLHNSFQDSPDCILLQPFLNRITLHCYYGMKALYPSFIHLKFFIFYSQKMSHQQLPSSAVFSVRIMMQTVMMTMNSPGVVYVMQMLFLGAMAAMMTCIVEDALG